MTTANNREAIAAPEMRARATMRSREDVFATVAGDRLLGRVYANGMAGVGDALGVEVNNQRVVGRGKRQKEREKVESSVLAAVYPRTRHVVLLFWDTT